MLARCEGAAAAVDTPIGRMPHAHDLDTAGLRLPAAALEALLHVDPAGWQREMAALGDYFGEFGARLPARLESERRRVLEALEADKPTRRAAQG
jgi:phosphoenolpyruvate carboxykinase (GTP)